LRKHISAPTPPIRFHNLCAHPRPVNPQKLSTLPGIFHVSLGTGAAVVASATQKLWYETQGKPHSFLHRPSFGPIPVPKNKTYHTEQHIWCEFGDRRSCGRECNRNRNCGATLRENHTAFYTGHRLAPFQSPEIKHTILTSIFGVSLGTGEPVVASAKETEIVLQQSGKTTPLFTQAIDWPHSSPHKSNIPY